MLMTLSRRAFLTSTLASALLVNHKARADEPFPVKISEAKQVNYKFQRRDMEFDTVEPAGTIVVDPRKRFLYFVQGNGIATRYGVSVGKSAKAWTGEVVIKKMAEWPVWTPSPYHLEQIPSLIKHRNGMPGGPGNPLGARALYLYKGEVDTINRIHGAAKPSEIGNAKTAGCIALLNVDVIDLYARVQVGTRVVMLG
jgi:lipoprotein-anchoring transpeptidase ErfK/SrfK